MSEVYSGVLEIDHDRGVIYFHLGIADGMRLGMTTMLRICSLPRPIPRDIMLDITHMVGVNWSGGMDPEKRMENWKPKKDSGK